VKLLGKFIADHGYPKFGGTASETSISRRHIRQKDAGGIGVGMLDLFAFYIFSYLACDGFQRAGKMGG
jgi:hypothetical protein